MDLGTLTLDELFAETRRAAKVERTVAHAEARKKAAPVEPLGIFANPDNWTRTRGVALIHRGTQTFLGNFWEWQHRSVADARRLVRSLEPLSVEALEEVDFGLSAVWTPLVPAHKAETQRIITLDVSLDTPRVSASSVLLCIHCYDGWTARVVLVEPTTFAEEGEILQLPAGVNILPVLSREAKIAIRAAL